MCDCRCSDKSEKSAENPTCLESQHRCKLKDIEQKCYLDFPDRQNFNEFLRICPSHGDKSKPHVKGEESCLSTCLQKCDTDSFINFEDGLPKALDSVGEYLEMIQRNASLYSSFPKCNPGSAADTIHKRQKALSLGSFIERPRSPVATETHSFRAQKVGEFAQPKPHNLNVSSHVYQYCRNLGMIDEMARLFEAEIRHNTPEDYLQGPSCRNVPLIFLPDSLQHLNMREFPGGKFFVCGIRYKAFSDVPDLHFGDQILEIVPSWIQGQNTGRQNLSRVLENRYFFARVIPNPFYRKVILRAYDDYILKESDLCSNRGTRKPEITRSSIDLGFSLHQRKITNVVESSLAKLAGLKINDVIIEVKGESVLEYSDSHVIQMIRTALQKSEARSVEIAVVPARIYDTLTNPLNGKVFNLNQHAKLDVKAWSHNKIFGVEPV